MKMNGFKMSILKKEYKRVRILFALCLIYLFNSDAFAAPFAYVTDYYSQDIRVIDLQNNNIIKVMPTDQKYFGGFGIDELNHKIYFGNEGYLGSISVFDYSTNSYTTTFPLSNIGYVENIVVASGGQKIYLPVSRTYYPDQIERVEVVDATTYTVQKVISLEGYGYGATFGMLSPDGSRLYISCRWSNNIVVIDTNTDEVSSVINIAAGNSPVGLAITPDGKKLYVLTRWDGGYINVIDADPASPTYHQVIKTVMTGLSTGFTTLPVFSPDGAKLYFTYPNSNKIVAFNVQTDEIIAIADTTGVDPSWIVISPDGQYLYITSWGSNLVEVINSSTLSTTQILPMGDGTWEIMLVNDTTSPIGSVVINNNATLTNSTSVTLTLSASDNLSGVAQMCISSSSTCTAWESFATTKSWTLSGGEGANMVYAQYKDGAGNLSSIASSSITLDITPPTGSIVINNDAPATTSTNVTLTLSASDNLSGIAQMCVSNTTSCSAWETFATTKSWSLGTPTSGSTVYVYVWYKDLAGNVVTTPYSDSIRYSGHL